MRFSEEEIQTARRLRDNGLAWEPQAGHYVYDETGFCKQTSPFQDKVYFILNYPYFMRAVGGVERFKEIMLWLPTWHDLRQMLRDLKVTDLQVAMYLKERKAIELGDERLALYELMGECLSKASVLKTTAHE